MEIVYRCRLLAVFSAFVFLSSIVLASESKIPYFLKESSPVKPSSPRQDNEGSKRINVSADFSFINPQSKIEQIKVMLPGRIVILQKRKSVKRGKNNYSWFGKVYGESFSSAVLTVVNGRMSGRIDSLGKTYYINPAAKDYVVIESNPSLMGQLGNDAIIPLPTKTQFVPLKAESLQEDGSRIDVLILYTQAMKNRYGNDLGSMIQNFVDLTNQAYSNSLITTTISLVHTELYTNTDADEVVTIGVALDTVTNDPAVETLRNSYKADLVSLLRVYQGSGSCGLAWIMTDVNSLFADNAFSVIEVKKQSEAGNGKSYCDNLSFAHEIGHNLGCLHDRSHISALNFTGAFDYSYGYDSGEAEISSTIFATIMSYDDGGIPYFSNPSVFTDGIAIGREEGLPDSADNAKTINNTKATAANFRTGEDKNVSISPLFYNFGNVKLTENPKMLTFTISNNVSSNIIINNSVISGADSTEFSIITDTCSSTTLSASSSCTIDISFSPASEGEKNSYLSLVYNGLTESPVTASISGIAILCGTSPAISKVKKKKSSYGDILTIKGIDFCTDAGKVSFSKSGKTIELLSFDSWKDNEIILKVPWGIKSGKNKLKAVTSAGLESNSKKFILKKPFPKITKVKPRKGKALSQITISGWNFGVKDKKSKVFFNNAKTSVITWTNETLTLKVPDVNLKKKKKKTYRIKVKTYYGTSNSKKFKVLNSPGR